MTLTPMLINDNDSLDLELHTGELKQVVGGLWWLLLTSCKDKKDETKDEKTWLDTLGCEAVKSGAEHPTLPCGSTSSGSNGGGNQVKDGTGGCIDPALPF